MSCHFDYFGDSRGLGFPTAKLRAPLDNSILTHDRYDSKKTKKKHFFLVGDNSIIALITGR